MTAGRRNRWRERATPARQDTPLHGHLPAARAEPGTARARRRRIVTATGIGGTGLLGISLSTKAGSSQFYLLTMGLAGTSAAGTLSSGPFPLGTAQGPQGAHRRLAVMPVLTGAGAFGLFYGAARMARHVPPLNRAIGSVLHYADDGSTPLVLLIAVANAVAEELFSAARSGPSRRSHTPSSQPPSPTPPRPPRRATPRSCSPGLPRVFFSASSAGSPAAVWPRPPPTSHGRSSCCAISRPSPRPPPGRDHPALTARAAWQTAPDSAPAPHGTSRPARGSPWILLSFPAAPAISL